MDIRQNMKRIMDAEAAAIRDIAITDAFEDGIQLLMATPGRVITTGIGKAGFIARKFAATLASTGTPAFFIHPAEAGHGDLGMVTEHDAIVAFSTSGKSTEVIQTLQIARTLGVSRIVGITSHPDSPMRSFCEVILDMGSDLVEPCPLKLTPSASIAVMLAISDAVALTLMELKAFTKQDYGRRHHSGYLGSITRPSN